MHNKCHFKGDDIERNSTGTLQYVHSLADKKSGMEQP